jgi:hypothetical protein
MLAIRCAWCGRWSSWRDRLKKALGARISHGMCPRCAAAFDGGGS